MCYLVLHEIAEFDYSFSLTLTKVELKHLIWDFKTKNVGSSLPKYSVVSKLGEATGKFSGMTIYVQSPLQELDSFLEMNKLPTNLNYDRNCFQVD